MADLNPAQQARAAWRMAAKQKRHAAQDKLVATVAERSGWHTGYSKGIDPKTLAVYAQDAPVEIKVTDTIQSVTRKDGNTTHTTVVHANVVILDNFSARRKTGVDTSKGIAPLAAHGKCYRVNPDGSKTEINRKGKATGKATATFDLGF